MTPFPVPTVDKALVYEDATRAGRAGLHALVVGVSAYPNLPLPKASTPPGGWPKNFLGLAQLESAALGACRIACWLIEHAAQLTPPLASVRLLLTPTAEERASPSWPACLVAPHPPTLDNLIAAAEGWRMAADGHADSTTLFYFAGHGIQRKLADHVLLLHDFGRRGPILRSAVSTSELVDGMRLSPARGNLARRQLYFFDACKLRPEALKGYEDLKTDLFWDSEAVGSDDRQYGIFYATAPGHAAYGNRGGHSLFCEAFLRCVNGGAAIRGSVSRPGNPPPWRLTVNSLETAMNYYLPVVAGEEGTVQTLGRESLGGDFQLRTFTTIPEVEVEINIEPGKATQCAGLVLMSEARVLVKQVDPPLATNPHVLSVQGGMYIFKALDRGTPRQYTDPAEFYLDVRPPRERLVFEFR